MARLAPYRIVPVTEFRRDATKLPGWVEYQEGRVWITKHGKATCAVVPMRQCELLERWEGRSLAEERERLARLYKRWKAIKAREPGTGLHLPWDWEREW